MPLPTLHEIALAYVEQLQGSLPGLTAELRRAEEAVATLQARIAVANRSGERLARYQADPAARNQCPRCWIKDDVRQPLRAIDGGTADADVFKCPGCFESFLVPVRR